MLDLSPLFALNKLSEELKIVVLFTDIKIEYCQENHTKIQRFLFLSFFFYIIKAF